MLSRSCSTEDQLYQLVGGETVSVAFPVQKQLESLHVASKENTTELNWTVFLHKKIFLRCFFYGFSNSFAFYPLFFAAKLGDTRELESFIDMLDRKLAGTYLRIVHPLSLNLFFIPFTLKLTSRQAAVCNGGGEADRVYVCYALKNRVRSSRLVSILHYPSHVYLWAPLVHKCNVWRPQVDYLSCL